MDVRSLVLLATFAIVGAGFAGCIEAPAFLNADGEVTAFKAKDAADQAALAWNEDAKLASVMTIELTNSTDARVPVDPEVGNGRALAWWYVYALETDAGMDVRAFRVVDGQAVEERDAETLGAAAAADMDGMDMEEIVGWEIDSDRAIEAAKTDERFRLAAQGFNATVVMGVARHHEMTEYATAEVAGGADGGEEATTESDMLVSGTIWWLVAGSVDGIVIALVDAQSGDLLEVRNLDMGFVMPEIDFSSAGQEAFVPEPIHVEGADELDGEAVEYPFEVHYPVSGDMDFSVSGDDALRGARWYILDEDEEVDAYSPRSWFPGMSEEGMEIEIDEPGDYILVIEESSRVPFAPVPGQPISFEFVLHLEPLGAEHEHDDEAQ